MKNNFIYLLLVCFCTISWVAFQQYNEITRLSTIVENSRAPRRFSNQSDKLVEEMNKFFSKSEGVAPSGNGTPAPNNRGRPESSYKASPESNDQSRNLKNILSDW